MALMEQLMVKLGMDASGYISEARKAGRATNDIAADAQKAGSKGGRAIGGLTDSVKGLGKQVAGAFAAKQVFDFIGDATNAAADLGESVNAVNVVFGNAADTIVNYGQTAATSVGLAATTFNSLATNTGALLTNFGFTQQQAADEAINLTERAADLASVFNTDVDEALFAVQAALRGETEPIRRFGVSLDDASVRAKAVELGLAATTAEVDKNGKAQAALALIYQQTASVQGDFANTSDSLANQQRILAAEFENAKAEIGQGLLPVAGELVGIVRDMLPSLVDAGKGFASVVAAAAPLLRLLGQGLGPALQAVAGYMDLVSEGALALGSIFGDEAATQALRFKEALDAVKAAQQNGTDQAAAYANGLVHMAREGALTADAVSQLGRGVEFVGQQQAVALREARDWAVANGAAQDQIDLLNDALYEQVTALIATGEVSEDMIDQLGLTALHAERTAEGMGEVGDAAAGSTDGMEEAAEGAETLAEKLLAARDAQESLANVLKAAADPAFAAVQAWQSYQSTLEDIDEDGKRTAEEQLELAKAVLEAQGALDAFTAGGVDDAASAISEALGLSVDEVKELLEQLGILDGQTVTTLVEVQVRENVTRNVAGYGGTYVPPEFRAAGGPVTAGRPYIVGEQGPEMFVPSTSGTIIPSGSMGAGGGDRNLNVTFVNSQLANDPMEGVRAAFAFDSLEGVA